MFTKNVLRAKDHLICNSRSSFLIRRTTPAFSCYDSQFRSISQNERNANRPMSPHITIYAWPLAAISSIGIRVSGVLLATGIYGIGLASLVGVDAAHVMTDLGSSPIGPLVKFSVSFPLSYHVLSSVRTFYWEKFPDMLSPSTQYQTSVGLFAVSGAISGVSMMI